LSAAPAAIVLAGGAASRFGGTDKVALELAGVSVLDRLLRALPAESEVVVVGPVRSVAREVRFTVEDPPGGGPVAALAAGLALTRAERTYLLAGDLPFVTPAVLAELADAIGDLDGSMALDVDRRDQPLLSCWATGRLRAAIPAEPAGAPLLKTLTALEVVRVPLTGHPPPWWDCDTPEAWEQALAWSTQWPDTR
jgi:molybdopterin-guanine dinucleotide biosynthesis protein A